MNNIFNYQIKVLYEWMQYKIVKDALVKFNKNFLIQYF